MERAGRAGRVATAERATSTRPTQRPATQRRWPLAAHLVVVLATALTGWLTVAYWRSGAVDVVEYAQYARAFWVGQPPFAAFPREYPPLSLLPFSLTLLPGPPTAQATFTLWMSLLFLAGYLGVLRFAGRRGAWRYAGYSLLGAQVTLFGRYDLFPALVTLAALLAAARRRFALAYVLLALGILIKLYPLALLPAVMIAQARASRISVSDPRRRSAVAGAVRRGVGQVAARLATLRVALPGMALCVALVGGVVAIAALRSPSALAFLGYASDRPIQIESLPASLLWLGGLAGIPAASGYAFGAETYTGVLGAPVLTLTTLALPLGGALVYWRQLSGRLSLLQAALLALSLVLLTSKIFSAQYVLWLLPVAALTGEDESLWALLAALTFLEFPLLYPYNLPTYTSAEEAAFLLAVTARNAVLLLITLRALFRRPTSAASPLRVRLLLAR